MKFVEIKKVPEMPRRRHDLQGMIKEFVDGDRRAVRVEYRPDEYKSSVIAYKCLYNAAKISGYRIKVIWREGMTYIVKV